MDTSGAAPAAGPRDVPERVPVLVAAGAATWETEALEQIAAAGRQVVLVKRCLDLTDLLASATTGTAAVALVSHLLPGLDADSVDRLGKAGVRVVAVVGDGPGPRAPGTDQDLAGAEEERMLRIGATRVLPADALGSLVSALRAVAAAPADPGRRDPSPGPRAVAQLRAESGDAVAPPTSPARAGTAAGRGSRPEPAPPRPGRLLVVWGPTGAPGRTTVALGLAVEAADRGIATCLLDADPYGGAVGQHLAVVDDTSGLLAAARSANAGLLDPIRLASVARQVGPGLRVVTGLPRPDRWREVRRQAFVELLDTARALDPLVVVDAGFGLSREAADPFDGAPHRDDMSMAALEAADDLVVVASADPVGLTRLARSMLELSDVVGRVPELVVVNRMRAGLGWAPRDVVDMVARVAPTAQVVFLPDDRAGADRALVSGRSLLESGDSALRRAVADLADRALPDVVPAGGRGGRGGSARGLRRRQTVSRR